MQPQGAPHEQVLTGSIQPVVVMPHQQAMVDQRDSLPIVIGVVFGLWNLLWVGLSSLLVIGGLFLADVGGTDDATTAIGSILIVFGIVALIVSLVGVYAGVEIARYKKRGVHIGLALIGISVIISLAMTTYSGATPDLFNIGCNGICAIFIALPLMISSIGAQME